MPTDLEQQLPRFAEALDGEAPTISVDEILRRGAVAIDVSRPVGQAWGEVARIAVGSGADAMPGPEHAARDVSIDLSPTAARPQTRPRVAPQVALAAAAAAVLVVALASIVRIGDAPEPADVPPSTLPTPSTTIPVASYVGVWLSIDTDGSSQTMDIARSGTDEYEVVIRDEAATAACAGGASTLTGTARLETDTSLVIAQPELTCDDGTVPAIGPPPQAELANFTFDRNPVNDELVDPFGVVWRREGSNDGEGTGLPTPTVLASDVGPAASASATSGGMWPQSTLEEVRAAQERADAGDPAYTWQVEPELVGAEHEEPGEVELVDRFFREVLGWEAYLLTPFEGTDRNGSYTDLNGQRYLRCASGRDNPLYPPGGPEPPHDLWKWAERCAPTIDELNYESVSLDLAQLDRRGDDGIWVVNRWERTEPFAQVDPAVVDAQAIERLDEFLAARIAGQGAEGLVELLEEGVDVPLLYATTSGASYERYEIERVDAWWPWGHGTFRVRLFADGDASVIEQEFVWANGALRMDDDATIENGQPLLLSHTSSDGELSVAVPSTWSTSLPGKAAGGFTQDLAPDVWFGGLWHPEEFFGSGERIEFVDPVAYDEWCAEYGGSPLLSAPADAAAIAQQLIADPDFETTAPVAARIGGREALSMDVALAPGGETCGVGVIDISRWIHGLGWTREAGLRLRLYLVDLPEGMSVETLAITVVAPKERLDQVIEETKPIIDSIEFHPQPA